MLTSLYTILYVVSLAEITSFVNSRKDMHSIKAYWRDGFHVAVDKNEKVIGTIAFIEKDDVHWREIPVQGKTVVISTVLEKVST